jgi:UDP-N-acetylmuramate dehydrogenase
MTIPAVHCRYASALDNRMSGASEVRWSRLLKAAEGAGLGGSIALDERLAKHASLRVGGPADVLVRVHTIDDLVGWTLQARRLGVPVLILGRGSNLLFDDRGWRGLVVENRCQAWWVEELGDDTAVVEVESGASLPALAQSLARMGWSGLEAGIGIPGSVGGAVVNNAGAHGWEIADCLDSIDVMTADGRARKLQREELQLAYRTSWLRRTPRSERALVLRARLGVKRAPVDQITELMDAFAQHRRATQPADPSIGSIFKNPPGDFAGRLIEQASLKGASAGAAQISPVHANFIVTRAGASSQDVLALIGRAQAEVEHRFGTRLELEIEVVREEGVRS